MKYALICCVLVLCSLFPVAANSPSQKTRQYAYVGGYGGIFGFLVKPDGSLQPLQANPSAPGLLFEQLLADAKTRTVFGVTVDDKIYSYAVGPDGHLFFESKTPFDAVSGTAIIDSRTHRLYAADGNHSLLVYDISNPAHVVRQENIATPIIIQNVALDQANHVLLLCGPPRTTGRGGSVLLRYFLQSRLQSAQKKRTLTPLQQGINTFAIAGPDLVTGNENTTLTVYNLQLGRSIELLSHSPPSKADAAHLPENIVYRHQGSFLYISTYYGAESAQAVKSASTIIVCHLGKGGQLGPQTKTGKPVPNPRPYLDKTGRFLYIVGEEGTVDAYKVAADGQLAPVGKRLKVVAPTGMVFVSEPAF